MISTDIRYRTSYENRLALVVQVLTDHQVPDAKAVAVKVLHAVDHIPESIR